jgi:hypothetical protein
MKREEMFEAFGDFDPSAHEEEAKRKYGNTASYAEAAKRTKRYTKDDWKAIRAEAEAINEGLAKALADGALATDVRAMDLAERARMHIDRWFYPCPHAMHAGLGEMYVSDPRFAEGYEKRRAGLAEYVRDAIRANTARAAKNRA